MTKSILSNIQIETKKKLVKVSLNGMRFPKAWWLYSESEIINPAKKAPKASDIPISEVNKAIDRQMRKILMVNNS